MNGSIKTETYGLKSQKTPPPIKELEDFENDLIELVKNIKFRTVHNHLQRTLISDIKLIQQTSKTLTPASKTSNMHRLTKEEKCVEVQQPQPIKKPIETSRKE